VSNETWDYVLAAAVQYAQTSADAATEGNPPTAFAEPVVYWANLAATDAALDYAKMTEQRVEPYVARLAVQLGTGFVMAMSVAQEILGVSYEEWSRSAAHEEKPWGQW
jgi:hypothetical protein